MADEAPRSRSAASRLIVDLRQLKGISSFSRLVPGLLVSSIGNGMHEIAIVLLALRIAPDGQAGLFVS